MPIEFNMISRPAITTYFIGAGSIALGLHCILRPKQEYARFGLPLEPAPRRSSRSQKHGIPDEGQPSPLIHLKGIREATYGLALITLQYLGQDEAVTVLNGIISLAGLGDGIVIWLYGGNKYRKKAFEHVGAFVALSGWSLWRAFYGRR
ncbi:hypothetical protein F5Y06DRAFT_258020 [Hypoxylon sp. FL0890]|nr:hypothetical protein F5Y06DRAFT_258020 [Hypoxylon sp. FL0890]